MPQRDGKNKLFDGGQRRPSCKERRSTRDTVQKVGTVRTRAGKDKVLSYRRYKKSVARQKRCRHEQSAVTFFGKDRDKI
jgi:hypothetical protein